MAQYWISYSSDDDPKRRRRPERERRWRWLWPWQWFRRGPRDPRPVGGTRRRSRGGGERRSIWPLLLLLLLLLLLMPIGAYFLLDESDDSDETERVASTGNLDPSSAPLGGSGIPTGAVPAADSGIVPDAGDVGASAPDLPSFDIRGDTTFMDLGDISCDAERYVLMTDGKVHMIEDLDTETVDALARSETPIDTVSLDGGGDTTALQAIAKSTGGTFTRMER